ncbi:MAG: ABC transporter [Sphingomonadales bacterium 32-68-7]|nr:MAG: ABC transporter [Sphingomonadales bacterium 12-68-11]OYX09712.1 MAG: ABC transporter [Sphingomonadales bacterium 32-68-7]
MAGGLIALLDDVAAIAKLAAASVDDVAAAAGKAGTKAAGVVIDDTAVTPGYVIGLSPDRELPIIGKIALGSIKNKLLFLLPAALALSAFLPWLVTPLLMLGGAYLCFEAAEKIWEAVSHTDHTAEVVAITDPKELEDRQVSGAVRTDFILSAEIMAISLNELPELSLGMQAAVLAAVAVAITGGVYGAVAVIVKLDDIGLHLVQRASRALQALGNALVHAMPVLLSVLSKVGTAAMLWVGGGILVHGLHEYHLTPVPDWVDAASHAAGSAAGAAAEWLAHAIGAAIVGLVVGGIVVAALHLMPRKRPAH